jgi:hypothetical protein
VQKTSRELISSRDNLKSVKLHQKPKINHYYV